MACQTFIIPRKEDDLSVQTLGLFSSWPEQPRNIDRKGLGLYCPLSTNVLTLTCAVRLSDSNILCRINSPIIA